MVSDLKNIGAGYTQGLSYAVSGRSASDSRISSPMASQRQDAQPWQETVSSEVRLQTGSSALSQLWDAKSAITGTAKGVRTAYQALDRADALLGQMAELVGMVKNYPPFPPGNEERVQYLNSIDGLRKMLQAVVVPPVEDQYQPVFYPRETKFPELDAKVPSDAAVLAFGEVVAALQGEVRMARQMLDAQAAQLYEQRAGNSPVPEEAQVPGLSATVATQLANVAWPIAGESNALAQLGG